MNNIKTTKYVQSTYKTIYANGVQQMRALAKIQNNKQHTQHESKKRKKKKPTNQIQTQTQTIFNNVAIDIHIDIYKHV